MKTNSTPNINQYHILNAALQEAKSLYEASEVHGYLCGYYCTGAALPDNTWLTLVAEFIGLNESPLTDTLEKTLISTKQKTLDQLQNNLINFDLLLPDDISSDDKLPEKTKSLGYWCQGFLVGFGTGYDYTHESLPHKTQELLTDFANIANVDDHIDSPEDDSLSLITIYMYVMESTQALFTLANEE